MVARLPRTDMSPIPVRLAKFCGAKSVEYYDNIKQTSRIGPKDIKFLSCEYSWQKFHIWRELLKLS